MIDLLSDLDRVLAASRKPYFNLATWIAQARARASHSNALAVGGSNDSVISATADFYEYNARNQITLWGTHITPIHSLIHSIVC
jgi:alpha-N-acetylglucosaminidase